MTRSRQRFFRNWASTYYVCCAAAMLLNHTVKAASVLWSGVGVGNDIETADNWTGSVLPTNTDVGLIGSPSTTLEVEYSNATALNAKTIELSDDAELSGGNLLVTDGNLSLANSAAAVVNGSLHLGRTVGVNDSQLTVSGDSTLEVMQDLRLGRAQRGAVFQSGSSVVNVGQNLDVGWRNNVAASSYTLDGGLLNVGGRLRIRRGSSFEINNLSSAIINGNVDVRHNGSGLNINSGSLSAQGNLLIRNRSQVNVGVQGSLNVDTNVTVLRNNSRFTLDGGNVTIGGRFLADQNGDVFLNSGNFETTGNTIAGSGAAEIQINNAMVTTQNLIAQNTGVITVAGGGVTVNNDLIVRNGGVLNQADGVLNTARFVTLQNQTAAASINISGGELNSSNSLRFIGMNNTLTQTGGEVAVMNSIVLSDAGGGSTGNTYNLTGGELSVSDRIIVANENTFNWGDGGTLKVFEGQTLIDYNGNLTAGMGSDLVLGSSAETLDVSGLLTLNGLTINGYNLFLDEKKSAFIETGFYDLVTTGSTISGDQVEFEGFLGSFATEINLGDSFDANVDDVYWFDTTQDNSIRVYWSLAPIAVPEPSAMILLSLGALSSLGRRSRVN